MARQGRRRDLQVRAEFIADELRRRQQDEKRRSLEKQWKEIDRQVAMTPKLKFPRAGTPNVGVWMSAVEPPAQADALDVLVSDIKRLLFVPANEDWYQAHGVLTDDYAERLKGLSIIAGDNSETPIGEVDQDTVDTITKAVLDYFHLQYDHKRHWAKIIIGGLKRGTYAGRLALVRRDVFTNEFRGVNAKSDLIPAVIPVSIKNLYLDDSSQAVMHEGMMIAPAFIRTLWQKKGDLERAAKSGGEGWLPREISQLSEKSPGGQQSPDSIEIAEFEGDMFIPRSQGEDMFRPGEIVTVAITGDPRVIRLRESPFPFRSYFAGPYEEDDEESPYGSSPLTRGRPLQEVAAEALNRTMDSVALNTEPPGTYDDQDVNLVAQGGPVIEPGAMYASGAPEKMIFHKIGDPGAMAAVMQQLFEMHEAVTKVNDPRRGSAGKSHTTAFAKDTEVSRSLLPTEDFVGQFQEGPLKTALYMEWFMAKKAMTSKAKTVFVDSRGLKGHLDLTKDHLPDDADFSVQGARGIFSRRERRERFIAFTQALAQIEQLAVQLGAQPSNWQEIKERLAREFEIDDADRFFQPPASSGGGPEATGSPGAVLPDDSEAA